MPGIRIDFPRVPACSRLTGKTTSTDTLSLRTPNNRPRSSAGNLTGSEAREDRCGRSVREPAAISAPRLSWTQAESSVAAKREERNAADGRHALLGAGWAGRDRKASLLAVLICSCLLVQGCAAAGRSSWVKRQATNGLYPTIADFVEVALRCDDPAILKTTMESYLLLLETLSRKSPKNRDLLVLASTLYAYYSFGFVVDEDLERARKLYWKGIALGKQALALNPSVKHALDRGEPFYKALEGLDPAEDVPAAYCTAMNQGMLLICSLDVMEAFAEANAYKALCDWIVRHEESYFHGATHTLLGVYYAIMPAVSGGGAEKAKKEFERAIALDNRLLLHYWGYARYYPTLVDDEGMYDELIRHILEADPATDPSLTALNTIAKKKARLLDRNRGLFF